jgi:hypothetical protein
LTGFALSQFARKSFEEKSKLRKKLSVFNFKIKLTRSRILRHPRQRPLDTRIRDSWSFVQIRRIPRRTRQIRSIQMRRT